MQKSSVKISPVDMAQRQQLGVRAGDTVRVWQKIEEIKIGKAANKKEVTTRQTRRQAFEGTVLAVKHGTEPGATFTVRRVASGVGVERIFPLYSPMVDTVEILRRARTRRSKLYFIRDKAAREARRLMRKSIHVAPAAAQEVLEEPISEAPQKEEATA